MQVSGETNSPTVIHTRNADEDTIKNLITNETEAFDIEVILEH